MPRAARREGVAGAGGFVRSILPGVREQMPRAERSEGESGQGFVASRDASGVARSLKTSPDSRPNLKLAEERGIRGKSRRQRRRAIPEDLSR